MLSEILGDIPLNEIQKLYGSHFFHGFFEVKKFAIMGVFDGLSGTCMAWVSQAFQNGGPFF